MCKYSLKFNLVQGEHDMISDIYDWKTQLSEMYSNIIILGWNWIMQVH